MKVKIIEDELYPYFYEAGKDCTIENDRAHPFCLHLWKPIALPLPTPPTIMV